MSCHRIPVLLVATLSVIGLFACGSDSSSDENGEGSGAACGTDADCSEGFVCNYLGECVERYMPAPGEQGEGSGIDDELSENGYPSGPYGTDMGDTIANHKFLDCDGGEVRLADFYGKTKVLWIYVTAGWCFPESTNEMIFAEEMNVTYEDEDLMVVLILGDGTLQVSEVTGEFCSDTVKGKGLTHYVLRDRGFEQTGKYCDPYTGGIPTNIILDHEFKISYLAEGWNSADGDQEQEIKDIVDDLIEEAKSDGL